MNKFKKKTIFLIIFISLLLLFGITWSSSNIPSWNISKLSFQDTMENPTLVDQYKDVSDMFNERGYYKSNGFSFDEQEIINDFNGNLIYNVPLYHYKMPGDMMFDLQLNYNGSTTHHCFVGNTTSYDAAGYEDRYNLNAPEWIISLDGIAVQVLNFETDFFIRPQSNGNYQTLSGDTLRYLIPGYHFNAFRVSDLVNRNRITILAGDGSLITLVNKSSNNDPYIGDYSYEGKEMYYKAVVEYSQYDPNPYFGYKNRIVKLLRGDGMMFTLEEEKRDFVDFPSNSLVNVKRKPQVLMLKEIRDRFGNFLTLEYTNIVPGTLSESLYGRRLLSCITAYGVSRNSEVFYFDYASSIIKIRHTSSINGDYTMRFATPVTYREMESTIYGTKNHKGYISQIINSSNQSTYIGYENYTRSFTNVINPVYGGVKNLTISFNTLDRMNYFRNNLNGSRRYTYFPTSSQNIQLNLINIEHHRIFSDRYYGYGRDAFYVNMIGSKKDSNGVDKSNTSVSYPYVDNGPSYIDEPVDENDLYTTVCQIESLDGSTKYQTPQTMKYEKEYKVYPVYNPNDLPTEIPDKNGINKLVNEKVYKENGTDVYKNSDFQYVLGDKINGNYNGSFLVSSKIETMLGQNRNWTYTYTHLAGGNPYDSVLLSSSVTDPLNNIKVVNYKYYLTTVTDKLFSNDYTNNNPYVTTNYYKIMVPTEELSQIGTTTISKKTYEYIDNNNDSRGYVGQLVSEKLYNQQNFSSYIETTYEYYKNDRTGESVFYGTGVFPFKEGNIKLVSKPNGEEEKYFYHPILLSEVTDPNNPYEDEPPFRRFKYKIKYNTGIIKDTNEVIWDHRLPFRIDNYKVNGSNRDTLSIAYHTYNEDGSPEKVFDQNKFLTLFQYLPVHRISSITLPGDFSNVANDTTLTIDTSYYESTINLNSNGWGNYDKIQQKAYYTANALCIDQDWCPDLYSMDIRALEGVNTQKGLFIRFDGSQLPRFARIDSAILDIAPLGYRHLANGDTSSSLITTTVQAVNSIYNSFQHDVRCCSWICPSTDCCPIGWQINIGINSYQHPVTIHADPYNWHPSSCGFKHNFLEIKNIFNNSYTFKGLFIYANFNGQPDHLTWDFEMNMVNCQGFDAPNWTLYASPKIIMSGLVDNSDTVRTIIYHGGTYVYQYDDVNHIVTVNSIMKHPPYEQQKVIKYHIDGSGNVSEKDLYYSTNGYNSYVYKFNYLNKPAENIDALNHSTKLSYETMERLNQTQNSDNSISTISYGYQGYLSNYFGTTYNSFVEKQLNTDETGRVFEKYFDAVGNLLREVKYINDPNEQNWESPFDPDTTVQQGYNPPAEIPLVTDYKYDNLYRLIEVKTPENKQIYYVYDPYGRQSQRTTPDAGLEKFIYDNNNNLVYSQDENQKNRASNIFTYRTYDALNRLTSIGETTLGNPNPNFNDLSPEETYEFSDPDNPSENVLTVNVYDTISTSNNILYNNRPTDYISGINYPKGNLAATAFKTHYTDSWNFKYYRYDEKGRVIKMWNYIDGLGWKTLENTYNSQNQVTRQWFQPNQSDGKLFSYSYDGAARLNNVSIYIGNSPQPEEEEDIPSLYQNLTSYSYNGNSQLSSQGYNNGATTGSFQYNSRNWLTAYTVNTDVFKHYLAYNENGNIRWSLSLGSYKDNFAYNEPLITSYIYDKSNRLLKADMQAQSNNSLDLIDSYDKDGNILTMKRYGSNNNLADNFAYQYYTNTNKLEKVSGSVDQYTYDNNGNMTKDELNRNYDFVYDFRNLITDFRSIRLEGTGPGATDVTYWTKYYYDEAGNRIRKMVWKYLGSEPNPVHDGDEPLTWQLVTNEFYVGDLNGKEIDLYSGTNLVQWNVWGLDNVGKINADGSKYFYYKDHLGSVRAIVDQNNQLVSAQDYDAWGYIMNNRNWQSENAMYKFTGKERDNESTYDYFGARYYMSRIGRWGMTDSLFMKHYDFSPYNYALTNPLRFVDPNGKQVDQQRVMAEYYLNKELEPYQKFFEQKNEELKRISHVLTEETGRIIAETIIAEGVKSGFHAVGIATFDLAIAVSTAILISYKDMDPKEMERLNTIEKSGQEQNLKKEITKEPQKKVLRYTKGFTEAPD